MLFHWYQSYQWTSRMHPHSAWSLRNDMHFTNGIPVDWVLFHWSLFVCIGQPPQSTIHLCGIYCTNILYRCTTSLHCYFFWNSPHFSLLFLFQVERQWEGPSFKGYILFLLKLSQSQKSLGRSPIQELSRIFGNLISWKKHLKDQDPRSMQRKDTVRFCFKF